MNAFVFMLQLSTLFNVKETKALHATMIMVPCLYAWSAHHGHQHSFHTPISFSSSYLFLFTISISISFTFWSSSPVSASLILYDISCFLRECHFLLFFNKERLHPLLALAIQGSSDITNIFLKYFLIVYQAEAFSASF